MRGIHSKTLMRCDSCNEAIGSMSIAQTIYLSGYVYCRNCERASKFLPHDNFAFQWDQDIFDTSFTDFELQANDGGIVRAHKVIMSGKSKVFKAMITSGMSESIQGRVQIPEMDVRELKAFVEFVYTGRVEARNLDLHAVALYKASVKYDLELLTGICESYLLTNVSKDIPGALSLVAEYDVEGLEEPLLPYIFSEGFVESNDVSYVNWAFAKAFTFRSFHLYKTRHAKELLTLSEKVIKRMAGRASGLKRTIKEAK